MNRRYDLLPDDDGDIPVENSGSRYIFSHKLEEVGVSPKAAVETLTRLLQ
jgi:hypothetical protein